MKRIIRSLAIAALILASFSCKEREGAADYNTIPLPQSISVTPRGCFTLDSKTAIITAEQTQELQRNARFLKEYICTSTSIKTSKSCTANSIEICINPERFEDSDSREAYLIEITTEKITITGASGAGLFQGIQTFRKSLPAKPLKRVILPCATIYNAPRFSYRGAHLDVARHFFTVDSIKRFIDILALHQINNFHWHLTDDQGWRIEIKRYPKLIEFSSKRERTVIGDNTQEYDSVPYGGYYTQEEAAEVVRYAAERYINVIPEIDMPGHTRSALAAYPELGCTGGPYTVWDRWGVTEEVLCPGKDFSLEFAKNVLEEILQIFPSKMIHIGGDECPKTRWAQCPHCRRRMEEEGLKTDEKHTDCEYLQSWFINRLEEYLNSKGRDMIGWDETLEGGLAPNAIVHSWQGVNGGIAAAKSGHRAIMSPQGFLYFNACQSHDTKSEPIANAGIITLDKCYSYEPIDPSLTPEEAKFIIGVQANLWTELITTFKHAEYMELPRLAALSEIQWMSPNRKDFKEFTRRLPRLMNLYDRLGYRYATHVFDPVATITADTTRSTVSVSIYTIDDAPIYYTLNGKKPSISDSQYTGPLSISDESVLKAVAIRGGKRSRTVGDSIHFNKATGRPIRSVNSTNRNYTFKGITTLVDGVHGDGNYKTGKWIAWYRNNMDVTIDLGSCESVSEVTINFCVEKGDWIFDARQIEVLASGDGKEFTSLGSLNNPPMNESDPNGVYTHTFTSNGCNARYVRVIAVPENSIPQWHPGAGYPGFIFVDEIIVK